MLYKGADDDSSKNGSSGFKFNLQSIVTDSPVTAWKADLIGQIDCFEQRFATQKADMLSKFSDNGIVQQTTTDGSNTTFSAMTTTVKL